MSVAIPSAYAPPTLEIPTYKFKVPPKSRKWPGDPGGFTIRQYTVAQELDALRVAKSGVELEYELIQRTVTEIDGKPVDQGINFLENFSPLVRKFFQLALNKINVPEEDDTKAFLASMETIV